MWIDQTMSRFDLEWDSGDMKGFLSNEETIAHDELDTLWRHIPEERRAQRISKDDIF